LKDLLLQDIYDPVDCEQQELHICDSLVGVNLLPQFIINCCWQRIIIINILTIQSFSCTYHWIVA